jgi:GDSL-like Lipase/Acylhydrolase family
VEPKTQPFKARGERLSPGWDDQRRQAVIPVVRTYAVLGDSFSATPNRMGRYWLDDVTRWLERANRGLELHNLAEPGATSEDVRSRQLPGLEELAPDLVTVVCGANDILLAAQPDLCGYARRLREIITRARAASTAVRVVTATCPDHVGSLPLTSRALANLRNAIALLNEATRAVARGTGVSCVELGSSQTNIGRGRSVPPQTTDEVASAFIAAIAGPPPAGLPGTRTVAPAEGWTPVAAT